MDTLIGVTPINALSINNDPQENTRLAIQSAKRFQADIQSTQNEPNKFMYVNSDELLNLCIEFLKSKGVI